MYNDLYHIGMPRRSGRYKWGSGKNPYHHGTSTAAGHKRKRPSLFRKNKKNKVVKKEVIKNPTEKQKANIITSADPKQVHKYKRFLSNDELQAAINRINLDRQINDITREEKHKGLKKFDEMATTWNKTANSVAKIAQGYDVYAKINNAMVNNRKNKSQLMPVTGVTASGGGKKKKKKK